MSATERWVVVTQMVLQHWTMKHMMPVATALLVVGLLAGCSAGGGSSTSGSSSSSDGTSSGITSGGTQSGAVKPAAKPASDGSSATERAVVTTGTVVLTVERPSKSADAAAAIVDRAGGRVDARNEKAPADGDQGSATLTLRIPSAALDSTLHELRSLGTVVSVDVSAQDVTGDVQDLAARIAALRTSVDRLTALLARATTTTDLITIESTLSDRQASLESLEAQQRVLGDQVDLATITLQLGSVASAPKKVPATFLSGLGAGWDSLVTFFAALVVVLGVLLPWLVLAVAVTVIVLGSIRFAKRRRRGESAAE